MMEILGVEFRTIGGSVEAELSGHAPFGDRGYTVSITGWANTEDEACALIAEGLQALESSDALQLFAAADPRVAAHKLRVAERWALALKIARGGEVTEAEVQQPDFKWILNIAEELRRAASDP